MRRFPSRLIAVFSFLLTLLAAPAQAQLMAGRDFAAIEPPLATDTPAKIEVIEFFSYACPHCNELSPQINRWAAKLPADVAFKRVAVGFNNPFYQQMARLYYALEAIGELRHLDAAVFSAIHDKGLKLVDEKSILEWVTSQGVDAKKFSDAYHAFGVISKTSRADQLAQAAHITGVPAIVVDGRYLLVGKEIRTYADLLALADKVIEKRRAERGGKAK